MKLYRTLAIALSSMLFFSHALANVIYENREFFDAQDAAQISPPQSLSNSFTVAAQAQLTSVTLGLWSVLVGQNAPESLTWEIGSTPFASDIGSATVALNNVFQFSTRGFFVFLSSFNLDLTLNAGSYWLTLSNGSSSIDPFLGWDISNGPSAAFFQNNIDAGPAPSEYFKLEGEFFDNPVPVSEPPLAALFSLGLLGLSAAQRRRFSR